MRNSKKIYMHFRTSDFVKACDCESKSLDDAFLTLPRSLSLHHIYLFMNTFSCTYFFLALITLCLSFTFIHALFYANRQNTVPRFVP